MLVHARLVTNGVALSINHRKCQKSVSIPFSKCVKHSHATQHNPTTNINWPLQAGLTLTLILRIFSGSYSCLEISTREITRRGFCLHKTC